MWLGNLNNQKGLVTSSQNTFRKFKLRDKTSADSTNATQLKPQDKEVTKTMQGTACKTKPNFLEDKEPPGVEASPKQTKTIKGETRQNTLDIQDRNATPSFLSWEFAQNIHQKVMSLHHGSKTKSETSSHV